MAINELKHRKWFKGKEGIKTLREMKAKIRVFRVGDTGEAKPKPYRAIACVGGVGTLRRDGFYPRKAGTRCGEGRGKSPTAAIRVAFRDLGKNFK